MGEKNSAPQAPDLSGISGAQQDLANAATDRGNQQYQWAQDQFAKNSGNTDQFIDSALDSENALNGQAATDRSTYDSTFTPELKQQQEEADNYATEQRKDQDMAAAQSNVANQFEGARNAATQNLESYGVNPASTRFAALDIGTRTQQAAAEAAAGTNAANTDDQIQRNLQQQVIQNSSPLANQSTNETNSAVNTGATAVNAGNSTTQTGASTMGTAPQYDSIAGSDLTGAANTINQGYQNQLNQFEANQQASSGIGSLLGGIAGLGLGIGGFKTAGGGSVGAKILGFAKGGAVPAVGDASGGAVPVDASPSRGAVTDDVSASVDGAPIRVNAGEFITPKDVTAWLGQKHMQQQILKARAEMQKATARPAVGAPPPQSRPQQGAIPMGA